MAKATSGRTKSTKFAVTEALAVSSVSADPLASMQSLTTSFDRNAISKDFPTDLVFVEETKGDIDLSGVDFSSLGSKRSQVTLMFSANTGTLDAKSAPGIAVTGDGTGAITITGTLADVVRYMSDPAAISYTGALDVFGENAATISVAAVANNQFIDLQSFSLSITDVADLRQGTPLPDIMTGDAGMDIIVGMGSNDVLNGLAGNDTIFGEAGNDTITGGAGADSMDGGDGEDVLMYRESGAAVVIDLNADAAGNQHASGGDAEGDIIKGFEDVYATDFDDLVIGNAEDNVLFGYGGVDTLIGNDGNDVIRGGEGADIMMGGNGLDWARYLESSAGVNINLNADANGIQAASGGDAQGDILSGFENLQGSDHADVLAGNAVANYLIGFKGNDSIDAGAGNDTVRGGEGADTLAGGDGMDLLQYTGSASGVTVNLNADAAGMQSAAGGDAAGDVISGFENVYGSNHGDVLTGDAARNTLYGYDGQDTLDGGGANDILRGGADADTFVFSTALGSGNMDRIIDFVAGEDIIALSASVFAGLSLGALAAELFVANVSGLAETADQRVVYETDTGKLYFDADGLGGASGIAFAHLSSLPGIGADDFQII